MKICTSYYAKAKPSAKENKIPNTMTLVSISIYPPKFYFGLHYPKLAPTKEILNAWKANPDEKAYIEAYNRDVLSKLTPDQVYKDLRILTGERDCVLLCFEKSSDFCHRHLVSEWMRKGGYDVQEWTTEEA